MEKEKLKTRIAQLESWLSDIHPEHMGVSEIQADLRKAKEDLAELENPNTASDERK